MAGIESVSNFGTENIELMIEKVLIAPSYSSN